MLRYLSGDHPPNPAEEETWLSPVVLVPDRGVMITPEATVRGIVVSEHAVPVHGNPLKPAWTAGKLCYDGAFVQPLLFFGLDPNPVIEGDQSLFQHQVFQRGTFQALFAPTNHSTRSLRRPGRGSQPRGCHHHFVSHR